MQPIEEENIFDSPLRQSLRQTQQLKVREFEWFEVETKIRMFVQKLLEPTVRQAIEDRQYINEVKDQIMNNNNEVHELKDIVLNQGVGIPIFNDINQRLFNIEMTIEDSKRNTKQEVERIDQIFKKLSIEQLERDKKIQQIDQSKDIIINDFLTLRNNNAEFKESVNQNLQSMAAEITSNFNYSKSNIMKHDEQFSLTDQQINSHQQQLNSLDLKLIEVKKFATSVNESLIKLITRTDQLELKLQQVEESLYLAKKIQNQNETILANIQSIENYIEKYQPLYLQGQISETLFNCLPSANIQKLVLYEHKRFEEIHKSILEDDGIPKLQQKVESYQQFLEIISKRNAKLAANIMANRKNNNNPEVSQSEEDSDDNVSQDKSQNQEKTKNQRENIDPFLMESLIKQQVGSVLGEYGNSLDMMEMRIGEMQKQIKEIDEQVFVNNYNTQLEFEKLGSKFKNDLDLIKKEFQKLVDSLDNNQGSHQKVYTEIAKIHQAIQKLINFNVLQTHLYIQDEIDRQGIALMGLREGYSDIINEPKGQYNNNSEIITSNNLPPINQKGQPLKSLKNTMAVNIDQKCLQCSGNPLPTMQAFKMACLAYTPSDVSVDGKLFKRDHLLEIASKILQQAKKDLSF